MVMTDAGPALLDAARALLPSIRQAADQIELERRLPQRLVQAVDLMYGAAGGTSVYTRGPLERLFRDIHTLAQHAMFSPVTLEPAGRMLLGMEPEAPFF